MLCNAVLVIGKNRMMWVEDQASIDQWDRVEDSITVGEITDPNQMLEIGQLYLSIYSQPVESITAELSSTAPDMALGRTATVGSYTDVQCVGKTFSLDDTGTLVVKPEFTTRLEDDLRLKREKLDRMIKGMGGTFGSSAEPLDLGTNITSGKIDSLKLESWSWSKATDLDNMWDPDVQEGDGGIFGHPYEMEEPGRLYKWLINCRAYDDFGDQLTIGDTAFELYLDDAPMPTRFIIVLGPTDETKEQFIYGPAYVRAKQTLRPVNLYNGGHEQGTIQLLGTIPV